MTFAELIDALETRAALKASRMKDCRTSLRYLASALGYSSLEECPVEDACRDPATWTGALETHFQALTDQGRAISALTRRNTRNNCRAIFRQAEAHGLLQAPLPLRLLARPLHRVFAHHHRETAPYQSTYRPQTGPRRFGLTQAQWPPDIQAGWRDYTTECGHRETTLQGYRACLGTYLGYLVHVCGRAPVWGDLFDRAQLREFVRWHGARLGQHHTTQGRNVVIVIAAMAKVLHHEHARALADFRNTLKKPAPTHDKRHHWVSLAQLEAVATALLADGRLPVVPHGHHAEHPGAKRASRFQCGLILKILVRIPLRQRNIREIRLGHNLYQDTQTGHWHLHFRGDELKIGTRGQKVNEYHVNLTDDTTGLVPVLEEFLDVYRPLLPGAQQSPFLFLTRVGKPFSAGALGVQLKTAVAMRTGIRFYPHLVRSIWATTAIAKKAEPATIAVALGDTVQTVMSTYYDVDTKDQRTKAKAFLDAELRTG
jgi:hypothetical protein